MEQINETFNGEPIIVEDRGEEFIMRYAAKVRVPGPSQSRGTHYAMGIGKTIQSAIRNCKKQAQVQIEGDKRISHV